MARRSGLQLDLVEVMLVVVFTAAATVAGSALVFEQVLERWDGLPDWEAVPLESRYGPDRASRHNEEWIIRDFFADRRNGVFVDVGANHYRTESNTYYLDTVLGWTGIAVEPLREFAADYERYRPGTQFHAFFVSDVSDEFETLYVPRGNSLVTSGVREFSELQGLRVEELTVPTITLTALLDHENVESFDFLSMDIELWEPKALAGFDVERFRPSLVCIETHPEVRQQILDYFARHSYVVVGKYLRADVWNLYFTPIAASGPSVSR